LGADNGNNIVVDVVDVVDTVGMVWCVDESTESCTTTTLPSHCFICAINAIFSANSSNNSLLFISLSLFRGTYTASWNHIDNCVTTCMHNMSWSIVLEKELTLNFPALFQLVINFDEKRSYIRSSCATCSAVW
jgi:hypothetical protein